MLLTNRIMSIDSKSLHLTFYRSLSLYGFQQEEGKGKNKPKKTDAATTTAPDISTIELDP